MCEQALCSYYQANQISGTKMCAHVFKLQGVYSRSCHLWKEKLRRSKSTHMTHYWEKSSILLNRFPYFLLSKSTLQESNTSLCTENVFPPPTINSKLLFHLNKHSKSWSSTQLLIRRCWMNNNAKWWWLWMKNAIHFGVKMSL